MHLETIEYLTRELGINPRLPRENVRRDNFSRIFFQHQIKELLYPNAIDISSSNRTEPVAREE